MLNGLKRDYNVIGKVALVLGLVFLVFSMMVILLMRNNLLKNEQIALQKLTQQVEHDLDYENGKWNTAKYNADPNTPHPSGSSGFASSLYIITADGFVIERTQPINGILDSADFKHLSKFQTPQTINIVTNEQWRVLSKPVTNQNNKTIGVAMVTYLNPQSQLLQSIDDKLLRNITYILSSVAIKNDEIDVSKVDVRDVDYDISFEIVNRFNRVLLNTGRVPTYIDPSYVEEELANAEGQTHFTDPDTGKVYLLYKKHLSDANNKPVGVIVAGKSIDYINNLMSNLLLPALGLGILACAVTPFLVYYLVIWSAKKQRDTEFNKKSDPETIAFDLQNSMLTIDKKAVQIPYATNQYELANAVFAAPAKRWELDELLEKFGETENFNNWRKVYDATLALNKRAGLKLVVYKDKTFRLNPDFVMKVRKS